MLVRPLKQQRTTPAKTWIALVFSQFSLLQWRGWWAQKLVGKGGCNFVADSMVKEVRDFQRLQFSETLSFPSLQLSPGPQLKLVMEASFYSQQQKPLQRMTYGMHVPLGIQKDTAWTQTSEKQFPKIR